VTKAPAIQESAPESIDDNAPPLKQRLIPLWLLIPALVAILISFIIPLIVLVRMSFNETGPGTTLIPAWSLDTYVRAVADPYYWKVILNTLKLGVIVSLITIVLSYPIALFLTKTTSKWKGFLFALAIGPLLTSQIARTFGWIAILGNEGAVNSALLKIGLIDTPLQLSNNFAGTVIALVEVLMPYALLGMVSGFSRVSTELELAAGVLGANPLVRFWRVTLPLSLPGVFTGFLLVFVLTISSFVTPHLLGGGRVHVLATEIYDEATQTLNWPLAASLAVILLILFGVLVSVYQSLTKKLGS
jgi:putative spermidine/putrescine transport system permease protein